MPGRVQPEPSCRPFTPGPRPYLKYPIFTPASPALFGQNIDMFSVIRQNVSGLLLHPLLPEGPFAPVLDFVRLAAAVRRYWPIKQTLYRAGHESPVVMPGFGSQLRQRRNGDRGDARTLRTKKPQNLELFQPLAGSWAARHVTVRRLQDPRQSDTRPCARNGGIRRYCHLGTGTINQRRRAYTDYGISHLHDRSGRTCTSCS